MTIHACTFLKWLIRFWRSYGLGTVLALGLIYFIYRSSSKPADVSQLKPTQTSTESFNAMQFLSYYQSLQAKATQSKNILLALVDMGAYEMAMNFYETSLKKLNISSYLFLSPSHKACNLLSSQDVTCVQYGFDSASDERSDFMSKDFIRKMNIRTDMILEALELGYNVLHSDVDMIFYKNPFEVLPCGNGSCDVAIMWDAVVHNAGFLYIRSTPYSLQLYRNMKMTTNTTNQDDQTALNNALASLRGKIRVLSLDKSKYTCGKYFYESRQNKGDGLPADYTKDVIVVHNNWIVGSEAKIYRFKEMQQWYYDGTDGYYSNPVRNYLLYRNTNFTTVHQEPETEWKRQKTALENALSIGAILNRTVILPEFYCHQNLCSLLSWIKLKQFDAVFENKYREHLFLLHPKVPLSTFSSLSLEYSFILDSDVNMKVQRLSGMELRPKDSKEGPTSTEIYDWFGQKTEKVLQFSSMDIDFRHLKTIPFDKYGTISKAFDDAFVPGNYRQY